MSEVTAGIPPQTAGRILEKDLEARPDLLQLLDKNDNIRSIDELEKEIVVHAIAHYKGQMSEVSRRLGIGRSTLYRKLTKWNISARFLR